MDIFSALLCGASMNCAAYLLKGDIYQPIEPAKNGEIGARLGWLIDILEG